MISQPSEAAALSRSLGDAISDLQKLAKQNRPHPSRYHARDILIPLGLMLASEHEFDRDEILKRMATLTKPFGELWLRVVAEELQLACAEFVTSVDERYLKLDNYDFNYTTAARERLGARLLACDFLGYEIPEAISAQISVADQIYGPFLARYQAREG